MRTGKYEESYGRRFEIEIVAGQKFYVCDWCNMRSWSTLVKAVECCNAERDRERCRQKSAMQRAKAQLPKQLKFSIRLDNSADQLS